ncbi:hypothetical protein L202_03356 [Cryptococcus amylolentus CBS 6039]|uniref:Sulfatase N-terminal domain-containing protein n=1 Tax=Cryptococcus amylolentus CBS 6039 TaxID=1295533 RepID=A0A1E3HSQ9_9TREE|nr:hypothetical protein L202_03356 [Cryptococcus amylolentus CBS 6039]ODN79352.1 hypothetical protein L202_03356 [Cryptococcus amylolentus CBS 6039]
MKREDPRLLGIIPRCMSTKRHALSCRIFFEIHTKQDQLPDGFYSSQFYVDNLLRYFHEQDRDKHKDLYDAGPAVLRLQLLENLKKLGLIPRDVDPVEVVANGAKNWEEMSVWEKKMSSRAMEVYAGMVHAMDREIGKVVDYLEKNGELDNTVVIFMSDNGAEGAALGYADHGPEAAGNNREYYDNSYENLGNHNSFIWYGPQWAQASTAPNRLMKAFSTEGGIRVPMLIRYPGFNQLPLGSVSTAFTTCMDLMPTFLELAGAQHPNHSPTSPTERVPYRGHQVYPMRGKSWVPYLRDGYTSIGKDGDENEAVHGENDHPVGWELHARAALRKGRWKIVNQPLGEHGTGGWELYDLSTDRGEKHDLAQKLPDKLKELVADWGRYEEETGTVFGPPIKHARGHGEPIQKEHVSGDVVQDKKAWMRVGHGRKLGHEA